MSPKKFGGLDVELAGRYKKRVDLQHVLARDLAFTGSLAFALVLAYVALHFRRVSAVLLVMAPLLFGLELVYGLAGFGFGTLNVLTAFVGAILLGIGIDSGIHMLGRYDEASATAPPEEGVCRSPMPAGFRWRPRSRPPPRRLSRPPIFAHFASSACHGCGMLPPAASYVTLLPALLGLYTRYHRARRPPRRISTCRSFEPRPGRALADGRP